jgi:hypothetical protein
VNPHPPGFQRTRSIRGPARHCFKMTHDGLRLTAISEGRARKQQRTARLEALNLQCAEVHLRHDEAAFALEATGAPVPSTPLKA